MYKLKHTNNSFKRLDDQMQQISFVINEISKFPHFDKDLACSWLGIEHPKLGGKMPIDLIKNGRFNDVKIFIEELKTEEGIV